MNEFKLNYEAFLAATRQHFFSSDPASDLAEVMASDERSSNHCGEGQHRAHTAK